jgi:hypothetical protein
MSVIGVPGAEPCQSFRGGFPLQFPRLQNPEAAKSATHSLPSMVVLTSCLYGEISSTL